MPGSPSPAGSPRADLFPVLVVNAGSSSLKAAVLAADGTCLWREQRGWSAAGNGHLDHGVQERDGALEGVLEGWLPEVLAARIDELAFAAHRVVHGGNRFLAPTRLDAAALDGIEALVPLAPLHNGLALRVMRWLTAWRPDLTQWACFDTAFHRTLPAEAHTYALPATWRRQGLRRYGFHGLNHQHVSEVVGRAMPASGAVAEPPYPLRLISCHLGAGCSLCAIRDGRSIATTMGFTPMEGLVMATRCGSVDPGLLLHQLRTGMDTTVLDHALNAESGLLGLSELSGSMKDLRQAAAEGHEGAHLAIGVFRHQLLQGIGAMAASLGGVDVIALSGGIGEHDRTLLEELQGALAWLGPIRWMVVPADEEGVIARSCRSAAGLVDTSPEDLGFQP